MVVTGQSGGLRFSEQDARYDVDDEVPRLPAREPVRARSKGGRVRRNVHPAAPISCGDPQDSGEYCGEIYAGALTALLRAEAHVRLRRSDSAATAAKKKLPIKADLEYLRALLIQAERSPRPRQACSSMNWTCTLFGAVCVDFH